MTRDHTNQHEKVNTMEDYKTIIRQGKDGLRIAAQRPEHTWHQYIKLGTPLTIRDQKLAEYARYCVDADVDAFEQSIRSTTKRIAKMKQHLGNPDDKDAASRELDNRLAIARAVRDGYAPLIRGPQEISPAYKRTLREYDHLLLAYTPQGRVFSIDNLKGRLDDLSFHMDTYTTEAKQDQQAVSQLCVEEVPEFRQGWIVRAGYFHICPNALSRPELARQINVVCGLTNDKWTYRRSEAALKRLDNLLTGKGK
jgi:hypothetical protein